MIGNSLNLLKNEIFEFSKINREFVLCNEILKIGKQLEKLKIQLGPNEELQEFFWDKLNPEKNLLKLKNVTIICDHFNPCTLSFLSAIQALDLRNTDCSFKDIIPLLEKNNTVKLKDDTLLLALEEALKSKNFSHVNAALRTRSWNKGGLVECLIRLVEYAKATDDWNIFNCWENGELNNREGMAVFFNQLSNQARLAAYWDSIHEAAVSCEVPEGAVIPQKMQEFLALCKHPYITVCRKDESGSIQQDMKISYALALEIPPLKMALEANLKEKNNNTVEFQISENCFETILNFVETDKLPKDLSPELFMELALIAEMYFWSSLRNCLESKIDLSFPIEFEGEGIVDQFEEMLQLTLPDFVRRRYIGILASDFKYKYIANRPFNNFPNLLELSRVLPLLKEISSFEVIIDARTISSEFLHTLEKDHPYQGVSWLKFINCSTPESIFLIVSKFNSLSKCFPNIMTLVFDELPESGEVVEVLIKSLKRFPNIKSVELSSWGHSYFRYREMINNALGQA